jgi:hypothetical protein
MLSKIACHKLTTTSEKEVAATIVSKKYQEQGYIPKANITPIGSHLKGESSEIIGAFVSNEMYGTISLVLGDSSPLPMDSIYKDEVDILRNKNYRVAEVVQFAVDQDVSKKHLSFAEVSVAAAPLFGAVLSSAKEKDINYLCISVNPKHAPFYSLIGFNTIGEVKHYDSVDAPAVAMSLSIDFAYSHVFGNSVIGKLIQSFSLKQEKVWSI